MDTITNIFSSLGVDQSIFIQFPIVIVLYFVLRFLFLDKLQEVLDMREAQTTKLESSADEKFKEAEKLESEYSTRIDKAQVDAYKKFNEQREKALARQKQQIKDHEEKINDQLEQKRTELFSEMEIKKAEVMKTADGLSQNLVEKIIN